LSKGEINLKDIANGEMPQTTLPEESRTQEPNLQKSTSKSASAS
jgi:hypothetical protein